jgi:integration host factor subunit beta
MVRSEVVSVLSSKLDLTATQTNEFINLFFDAIVEALAEEGRVEIRGFGTFTVRKYKSYEGRNPKTREKIAFLANRFGIKTTGGWPWLNRLLF